MRLLHEFRTVVGSSLSLCLSRMYALGVLEIIPRQYSMCYNIYNIYVCARVDDRIHDDDDDGGINELINLAANTPRVLLTGCGADHGVFLKNNVLATISRAGYAR